MNTELGRFIQKERTMLLAFVSLFIVLSAIATLYIAGERRRNRLLAEYTVERTAGALLESYRDSNTIDDEIVEQIAGFGVYNAAGRAVIRFGDAPEAIKPHAADDTKAAYELDKSSSTMSLVRSIGVAPLLGGGVPSRRPTNMAELFVRVRVDGFLRQQAFLGLAYVVVPILFAGILFFIGRLYYRNWCFREKIDSQKNLVYLGEASRTLTHEIRNPLSAIQIQAGILRRILPEDQLEIAGVIEEEVGRLSSLTDRIRDFVKNPTGEPTNIDVLSLAKDLVSRYSWNIDISAEESTYLTHFDEGRLRSVLENLLKNAIEASEPESPISLIIERHRSKLQIAILDRGCGVPTEHQDKLFDPFFTMKEKGSGIGLSISNRFVTAAGGKLSLQQRKGGGAEVIMTLPAIFADERN